MRLELGVEKNLGRARVKRSRSSESEQDYRQILLFISPPGHISDAMTAAIEREFSWISVMQVSEPQAAIVKFDREVQLIVVDHCLLNSFQQHCCKLSEEHPGAVTAVMTDARHDQLTQLTEVIQSRTGCSILPNNVNIDIWLSIIRIMLKGGNYFPYTLLHPIQPPETSDSSVSAEDPHHHSGPYDQRSKMMNELTARELEVLAKVAQGHQNKIIAFDLGLSEHTIKIHIHNIIQKLGVHNRTQAAAKYFDHAHKNSEVDDNDSGREEEGNYDER